MRKYQFWALEMLGWFLWILVSALLNKSLIKKWDVVLSGSCACLYSLSQYKRTLACLAQPMELWSCSMQAKKTGKKCIFCLRQTASGLYRLSHTNALHDNQFYKPKDHSMKFSQKNLKFRFWFCLPSVNSLPSHGPSWMNHNKISESSKHEFCHVINAILHSSV